MHTHVGLVNLGNAEEVAAVSEGVTFQLQAHTHCPLMQSYPGLQPSAKELGDGMGCVRCSGFVPSGQFWGMFRRS